MVNSFMKAQKLTVHVECDVVCDWNGKAPIYRAWVNDELFAERTWDWRDVMLQECFQIRAPAGKYIIWYQLVHPQQAVLTVNNWRVILGPGRIDNKGNLEIRDETA